MHHLTEVGVTGGFVHKLLTLIKRKFGNFMTKPPNHHSAPTPNQLLLTNCSVRSIRKIFVPSFFAQTSFRSVRTLKLWSEYFAVWTSQLGNKGKVFVWITYWKYCTNTDNPLEEGHVKIIFLHVIASHFSSFAPNWNRLCTSSKNSISDTLVIFFLNKSASKYL